jgi:hypothetical protein
LVALLDGGEAIFVQLEGFHDGFDCLAVRLAGGLQRLKYLDGVAKPGGGGVEYSLLGIGKLLEGGDGFYRFCHLGEGCHRELL